MPRQVLVAVVTMTFLILGSHNSWSQAIPAYIPQDGLVGWWPFTTSATDESPGTNDGTVNGATLTTDRYGLPSSAYGFNGVNNNIAFANAINFGVNSFSVSLYVYVQPQSFQQAETYIYGSPFTPATFDQGFRFGTTSNRPGGGIGFLAAIGDVSTNDYTAYSQQPITTNAWYYLTMVFNRAAGTFTFYVNGQAVDVIQVSPNFANTDRGYAPTAGSFRLDNQTGNFFTGKIDDIAVWNRALTAQEVLNTYQACGFSIMVQPSNTSAAAGSNVTLSLTTTSPQSVSYQWQRKVNGNYVDIIDPIGYSGMLTSSLTINSLDASDTGSYRCAMTMNGCDVKSDEVVVSFPGTPTCDITITTQPSNASVDQGASKSLSVAATSAKTLSYQWQRDAGSGYSNISNGGSYSGATTSTLSISSFSSLTAGSFRCVVSNADCSVNSNVAVLSLRTSSCLENPGSPNPWPYPSAADAGYIALGNLGQQAKFSVSLWVKPAAVQPANVTVIMDCSHGGSNNWVIQTLNGGTTWRFLNNEWTMTPDVWQHLLVTYDGGTSKVYVDGSLVDQDTWVIQWSGTPNIYLGNWPEGGRRFKGQVDEVMITRNILQTAAFTPKKVYSDGDIPVNSLGLWHFDEGTGTVTKNEVTNATAAINNWTWASRDLTACDVTITGQPLGAVVGSGQSKSLTVTASSSAQISYQWQKDVGSGFANVSDGGVYSGAISATLTISTFSSSTAATYRCIVNTEICTLYSNSAVLTLSGTVNSWTKVRDSAQVLLNDIYFNPTAFDQVNNRIYGVNTQTSPMTVKVISLTDLTVETFQVTKPVTRIDHYTYDPSTNRLIATRAGRDNVYALNLTTKVWTQIGNGSQDDESYGAVPYWNKSANKPEFFAGYGYTTTKNWVYRNTGTGWSLIVANQNNCEPRKRTGAYTSLAHPDSNHIYFSGGQGNCSGNQTESSCTGGPAWANDLGKYCWLKDLYRYDIGTAKFTNMRPFADASYIGEGPIAYDYHENKMYQFPLFIPSATWGVSATVFDTTSAYVHTVGGGTGYTRVQTTGSLPPARSSGAVFYDGVNRRVVLLRTDGVWALQVGQSGCPITITTQPTSKNAFGGHSSTLTVSASSSAALSYQWQRKVDADFVNVSDGADYSGSNTETLSIKSSRISIKGPYRCVVSASGCIATSNEATLTVECPCNQ